VLLLLDLRHITKAIVGTVYFAIAITKRQMVLTAGTVLIQFPHHGVTEKILPLENRRESFAKRWVYLASVVEELN
jgi:hypothetical protein